MAFDPDAFLASTKAPVSGLESFGRGALQGASLGLSDEISGALESLFTKKTYVQARDESRANNAAAEAANPLTYGAGNLAGSVVPSLIPGAGVAKGASVLAAAGKAAVQGGIAGLGTSTADLTKGEFAKAAADTGTGAALAGTIGGLLHGLGGKVADQAGGTFEKEANADLFARARPKDALQAQRVQQSNPEIFRQTYYGEDFKPVLDLARAGKTEEAIDAAQTFIDKAGENRVANYETASKAGATGTTGSVVQRLRQEASAASSTVGRAEESRALSNMAKHIEDTQSVVESKALPDVLKALPGVPSSPTKADLWEAAMKASGAETAGTVPKPMAEAIQGLKFHYDPEAPIPLVKLRQITSAAQNASTEALGTIAESERSRITNATTKAVNGALEAHLDAAAMASPEARAAVEAIRHDDKVISIGLAAKDGLAQKLIKENTGRGTSFGERISGAAGNAAKLGGIALLGGGHLGGGLALEAAPFALKAVGSAARRANDTLARLLYAEGQGNAYAKTVLNGLRQTPQGAARLAALTAGGQQQ